MSWRDSTALTDYEIEDRRTEFWERNGVTFSDRPAYRPVYHPPTPVQQQLAYERYLGDALAELEKFWRMDAPGEPFAAYVDALPIGWRWFDERIVVPEGMPR